MPRDRLLTAVVLAALAVGAAHAQPSNETAPAECGPRCIEFLLHWYGQPADVSDLIDELQQGRAYQMVSLAALEEALHKRGVHTKAVRLGWGATLDWPHPAVRHSTRSDGMGHFTVLVPPQGEFPRLVWTGDAGYKRTLGEEDGEATGVYLLTAPEPISDVGPAVRRGTGLLAVGGGGAVLVGVGLIGLATRGRRRQAAGASVRHTEGVRCAG